MKQRIINFSMLLIILAGGIWTFYSLRGNPISQLYAGIATAGAYVAWGILYHWVEKDLHAKVVIEYILVGLIAIVLLATIILT